MDECTIPTYHHTVAYGWRLQSSQQKKESNTSRGLRIILSVDNTVLNLMSRALAEVFQIARVSKLRSI